MNSLSETVACQLSQHLTALEYNRLPSTAIEHAKRVILDQIGCQLIGSSMPWNTTIFSVISRFGGNAEATVVNYGRRILTHDAAFMNATYGQGCELDDYVTKNGVPCGHPGAMSVPVALAVGERDHVDGKTALVGVICGYETALRVGHAIPLSRPKGFHNQGIIGPFACASVAATMMKLTPLQLAHALAIAGSHSAGTTEFNVSGGEVKRMHAGLAARAGIQSALMASAGLTGPLTIFEGPRGGFLRCFGDQHDSSLVMKDAGRDLGIDYVAYKTLPVVAPIQSAILNFSSLMAEHKINPDDIDVIRIGLHQRGLTHGSGITRPHDTIGAQFSLAFSIALRIVFGRSDLALYADPTVWQDPRILRWVDKVQPFLDDEFVGEKEMGSRVIIALKSGDTIEGVEYYHKGNPKNAVTTDELISKFYTLAKTIFEDSRVDELVDTIINFEKLDDVRTLTSKLART